MGKLTEDIISHEVAILAKSKGFDIGTESSDSYTDKGTLTRASFLNYNEICYAPTQALLQRWLRESMDLKWNVLVYVVPFFSENPRQEQCFIVRRDKTIKLEPKDTYEEALEEGLFEGVKLIE